MPKQARGFRGQLLLDYETEFGKNPTTAKAIKMPFNTFNVGVNQNLTDDNTIRNRRDSAQPTKGNIDVNGQAVVPVDAVIFGYWLKALFGAPATEGDEPDGYVHVFKPGDDQPSFLLDKGFTDLDQYELLNGNKVSQLSMTVGGDGELTANIDIMGAKSDFSNVAYASDFTDLPLTKFGQFQSYLKEGDTEIAIVTQSDFTVNASLDGNQYVIGGKGTRGDIPEGIMQISGNLTALFKDRALLDKARLGTSTSLVFGFSNEVTGDSLEFAFPEVEFGQTSPGIDGPQGVVVTLPWRAYYKDNAENAAVVVTLLNQHASY